MNLLKEIKDLWGTFVTKQYDIEYVFDPPRQERGLGDMAFRVLVKKRYSFNYHPVDPDHTYLNIQSAITAKKLYQVADNLKKNKNVKN